MEHKKNKRSRAAAVYQKKARINNDVIIILSDDEPSEKNDRKRNASPQPSTSGTCSTISNGNISKRKKCKSRNSVTQDQDSDLDNRKTKEPVNEKRRKSPRKSIIHFEESDADDPKTKELAKPKNPKHLKKSENQDKEWDVGDPEANELVRTMETIRDILGAHYVNVVDRLKLLWTPHCVEDKEYCLAHHHRKCPSPKVVDELQSCLVGTFTKHNRTLHYLRAVQNMCIRSEFPGEDAIRKILETILISKQPEDSPYPKNYIIQHCLVVAEVIIMKFPPCWPDIKKVYRRVFLEGFDLKNFHRGDAGTKGQGIFPFLIDLVLETVTSQDGGGENPPNNGTDDSEPDDFTFDQWLAKRSSEEKFWDFTREEKLDRLFAVLHILTRILEYDLSIWLLRYPSKTTNVMFSNNGPLLTAAFLDNNLISSTVKKFIELFVICIGLQFPNHPTNVLSRLMNLLAVGTECCEKQRLAEEVVYPNIGSKVEQLVKTLLKTILDKFSCKVHYFLFVINKIQVPFVKYLLIDQLLRRLNPDHEEINVTKIYLLFKRERWQCSEGTRQLEEPPSALKYPVIPKKFSLKKTKANEIYMQEYLDVLLDCLQAYCESRQIREVICRAFVRKPTVPPATPIKNNSVKTEPNHKRLYMHKIEDDILELEQKVNRKKRFVKDMAKEHPFTGVYVGNTLLLQYREDVKYLGILLQHITPLYKNDPDMFKKWYKYLNKMLSA